MQKNKIGKNNKRRRKKKNEKKQCGTSTEMRIKRYQNDTLSRKWNFRFDRREKKSVE